MQTAPGPAAPKRRCWSCWRLSYYAGRAAGASVALAIVALYLLSLPLGRLRTARRQEPVPAGATIG